MTANVLIVDDEQVIHTLLKKGLVKLTDWQVASAFSFEQAVTAFIDGSFDLLLIDKNLSGQSGVDLVRQIRELDPHVGIAMITGHGSIESAVEMLHLDIDRYIEKPFDDMQQLVSLFGEIIDKTTRRRQLAAGPVVPRGSIPAPRLTDPGSEHTVLIVSPLSSEREWIARQLDGQSRIFHAASSGEAVTVIEKTPPDIVIVDMKVQEPDIFEFVQHLNEIVVGLDVAVISQRLSLHDVKRLIELDVAALIQKPLQEEDFRRRIAPLF